MANGERSGMMENRAELLTRQAGMTAYSYMRSAQDDIDAMFGEGYAKQHPKLVGAYTQAAAVNFVMSVGLGSGDGAYAKAEAVPV
jgi:hypothetical protein